VSMSSVGGSCPRKRAVIRDSTYWYIARSKEVMVRRRYQKTVTIMTKSRMSKRLNRYG
jgi:hypothetical protein